LIFKCPKKIQAIDIFSDTFENLNNWDVISNGFENSWYIEDSKLVGSVGYRGNSFLISKDSNFQNKFNITYKAINQIGVDQELLFGVNKNSPNFYLINVRFYEPGWTSDGANEVKLFNCFSFTTNSCTQKAVKKITDFSLQKNKEYNFRLEVDSGKVKFYIDNVLILDYVSSVNYGGNVGFWNWGGDYRLGVKNIIDDFSIEYGNFDIPIFTPTPTNEPTTTPTGTPIPTNTPVPTETPIPTQTPMPTETPLPTETPIPTATLIPTATPTAIPTSTPIPIEKKKKIFILPGLGASWNSRAIVYGDNVGDNDWKMTPFVNNYDGLIKLLEDNNMVRDVDYFIWNYDWRKPLSEIEIKFNNFVNTKNLSSNDDIYLIGHSLGGLVARLWSQDYQNDQVKEIITLGSPHLGSLDSYSVWNGGKVLNNKGVSSVVFKILLGLQNKGFLVTDLNKIRSFAPIVQDLLPTFDYVSKNDQIIPWMSLSSKNENLDNKNRNIETVVSKLNLFVGVGNSTPRVFNLGKRTLSDQVLGLWPDGRILNYDNSDGDGTVLKKSASAQVSNFMELNSDHGSIVNKSLSNIAQKLNLENKNFSFNYVDNFSDSLVVFIGSPAKAKLVCKDKIFEEIEGFIIVKNQGFNNCELLLYPTDSGVVHLVFGNTKSSNWNYLEKDVTVGKNEKIQINFSSGKIFYEKSDSKNLIKLIKSDLQELKLNKTIKFLERGDFVRVINDVFEFRSTNSERIVSQRILDNLFILSTIITQEKNNFGVKWLNDYLDFLDKMTIWKSIRKPISRNSAVSFTNLEKLVEEIEFVNNNKNYPSYQLIKALVLGYSMEILNF